MTAKELKDDSEFAKHWPLVWRKLRPYILLKQQEYGGKNKSDPAKVGQFVIFTQELFEDLEQIEPQIIASSSGSQQRPKLNNVHFQTPAIIAPTHTPNGQDRPTTIIPPSGTSRATHGSASRKPRTSTSTGAESTGSSTQQ